MTSLLQKIALRLRGNVIRIQPRRPIKGAVLLSYITLPFIAGEETLGAHTNRWECREIARIFAELGYAVDVVDWESERIPKRDYDIWFDIRPDMEKIAQKVHGDPYKIFHATGTYWKFQNEASRARLNAVAARRGARLSSGRFQKPGRSVEIADLITMLGNDFTASTYPLAGKRVVHIPISTTHIFPSPETKDFEAARRGFIWLGGAGMAHKGLDLVLEAFAAMPEFTLTAFGKGDADFINAYHKELYETPNISYKGQVDIGGREFAEAASRSIGLVFPSCSEGCAGSVIECMHVGLIPIISRESSVDVDGSGIVLRENTKDEIEKEVRRLASLPAAELASRATAAWAYARERHTREAFSDAFAALARDVDRLIKERRTAIL
ncbi:MAG: glycosyltransferase [Patescibacteria group bacterium]|nr:glycosyltransferase [Patescibacteria group bacterium]MDE2116373.1 glycosyltransferase [Patescibacteria group bacterium]